MHSPARFPQLLSPFDIQEELNLDRIFPRRAPIELELGAGDGSFLTKAASKYPDTNYIAVERLLGRLRKIERFARLNNTDNICCLRHEISYLLRFMIPESSIAAVHVYFPDPWPKKKHARNRLFRPHFTRWIARILVPNGKIYFRTDNVPYFEQLLHVFQGDPEFLPIDTPDSLSSIKTDFESHFNSLGIPTNYAAFTHTH